MSDKLRENVRASLAKQSGAEDHVSADLLNGYAERVLLPREQQFVEEHLSRCSRCRDYVFFAGSTAQANLEAERGNPVVEHDSEGFQFPSKLTDYLDKKVEGPPPPQSTPAPQRFTEVFSTPMDEMPQRVAAVRPPALTALFGSPVPQAGASAAPTLAASRTVESAKPLDEVQTPVLVDLPPGSPRRWFTLALGGGVAAMVIVAIVLVVRMQSVPAHNAAPTTAAQNTAPTPGSGSEQPPAPSSATPSQGSATSSQSGAVAAGSPQNAVAQLALPDIPHAGSPVGATQGSPSSGMPLAAKKSETSAVAGRPIAPPNVPSTSVTSARAPATAETMAGNQGVGGQAAKTSVVSAATTRTAPGAPVAAMVTSQATPAKPQGTASTQPTASAGGIPQQVHSSDAAMSNSFAAAREIPSQPRSVMAASPASGVHWRISPSGRLERSVSSDTWAPILADVPVVFHVVSVMGSTVWAGGSGGALYRSTDGGLHWSKVVVGSGNSSETGTITTVRFHDLQRGSVVTDTGSIWKTEDGGQTWTRQ